MKTKSHDTLRQRIGRFLGLAGGLFVVVVAVVVGQRLSRDALAMLVGLACGAALLAPTVVFAVWMWRRQEERLEEQRRSQSQPSSTPPIIVVTPPALPGYGVQRPDWETTGRQLPVAQQREFTIVGGETDMD
ncbi:MAG: hypothetical protein JXB35_00585 [Anaerolineae bacterium]|nr:hypothetical protein [Anaerolineae bacterium]